MPWLEIIYLLFSCQTPKFISNPKLYKQKEYHKMVIMSDDNYEHPYEGTHHGWR